MNSKQEITRHLTCFIFFKINQFILTAISVTFLYLGMRKRGGNTAVQMGLQAMVHGSHLWCQFPGQACCPSALARLLLLLPLLPKVAVTGRRPAEDVPAHPCSAHYVVVEPCARRRVSPSQELGGPQQSILSPAPHAFGGEDPKAEMLVLSVKKSR